MKIWIHGLQESVRLQTTYYWLVSQNDIYWQTSNLRGCRGHMEVGFTTTYAISAYHHWHEFESCVGEVYSIQHYVIKFVSNLSDRSVIFSGYSGFLLTEGATWSYGQITDEVTWSYGQITEGATWSYGS